MDHSVAQWQHLFDLITGTGSDDHNLGPALTDLVAAIQSTIPSYRGMRITLIVAGQELRLDAVPHPGQEPGIVTSLRLSIAAILPSQPADHPIGADGHIVFYASAAGAFVDLAADLENALGHRRVVGGEYLFDHPNRQIVVDLGDDLVVTDRVSALTGLDEVSAIDRAVGILIAEGHPPDQAHAELHRRAAAAGLAPHRYAARLLRR